MRTYTYGLRSANNGPQSRMTVRVKRTDRQSQKWSVSKDDGPYGPSTLGPGVITRCRLCIRTVSKNDGPCETYIANNGPSCKVVELHPLPHIPHRIFKVQCKTFQLLLIWNVLCNLSQLCTHNFHFTNSLRTFDASVVHRGCHACDLDFVHPHSG